MANLTNGAAGFSHLRPSRAGDAPWFLWRGKASCASPLVDALCSSISVTEIAQSNQISGALAAAPGAALIVLYDAPLDGMARAMAMQQLPSAALEQWLADAHELLGVLRAHRRACRLVEAGSVLLHPRAFADALNLPEHVVAAIEGLPRDEAQTRNPMLRILAHQALQADPLARVLAGELEATALALAPDDNASDTPDDAFSYWLSTHMTAEKSRLDATKELAMANAVQQQLLMVQAELERQFAERKALKQELSRQSQTAAASVTMLEEARTERADVESRLTGLLSAANDKSGLLQKEIERLQDHLVEKNNLESNLTSQAEHATRNSGILEKEIERLDVSRQALQDQSDAQGAELSRLKAGLQKSAREAEAATAENRFLTEKIGEVQIALDKQYGINRRLEAQSAEKAQLEQRLHQMGQGLESYERQIRSLTTEVDALRKQLDGSKTLSETRRQAIQNKNERIAALEAKQNELFENLTRTAKGSRERKYQIRHLEQLQTRMTEELQDGQAKFASERERFEVEIAKFKAARQHWQQIEATRGYRLMTRIQRLLAPFRRGRKS